MAQFTATQKEQMFPGKGFDLAKSMGLEMPASQFVDISDSKKIAAYEAANVQSVSISMGGKTVNIHILYNAQSEAIAAFSPENPNVAKAAVSTILKAIQSL
jgi:hypothetical protein